MIVGRDSPAVGLQLDAKMVGEERAALDGGSAGDWFERALEEVFADTPSTVGEAEKSAGIRD